MTTADRAKRIHDAIEATPEAVELRSLALELVAGGDAISAVLTAFSAAEAVIERNPAVMVDVEPEALRRHLVGQIIAIATGDHHAILDLKPATN